jgi:hypothetical protein
MVFLRVPWATERLSALKYWTSWLEYWVTINLYFYLVFDAFIILNLFGTAISGYHCINIGDCKLPVYSRGRGIGGTTYESGTGAAFSPFMSRVKRGAAAQGSIKRWEVLEWLHNWQLLKKGSTPWVSGWVSRCLGIVTIRSHFVVAEVLINPLLSKCSHMLLLSFCFRHHWLNCCLANDHILNSINISLTAVF